MSPELRIFADFQNSTPAGNVRLNCVGTLADIRRLGVQFYDGQRVLLDDADSHVADGVIRWEDGEGWVAVIDWERLRAENNE